MNKIFKVIRKKCKFRDNWVNSICRWRSCDMIKSSKNWNLMWDCFVNNCLTLLPLLNLNGQGSEILHENQLTTKRPFSLLWVNILTTGCWFTNNFTQSFSIRVRAGWICPMDQTSDEITIHFNQDTVSHKAGPRCCAGSSRWFCPISSKAEAARGKTLREPLNLMWLDSCCWGD